ncbi:MAG TPA: extracellular solute-binding protein [Actinomycetota bacterium]|nr:extracellular solute-binding protein [Actinomycetota bacterium]
MLDGVDDTDYVMRRRTSRSEGGRRGSDEPRGLSRRIFLRAAGAAALGVAFAGCGPSPGRERRAVSGSLPLVDGVPRIDPSTPIERGGTLRVYQWRNYLSRDVVDGFARRHAAAAVSVEVESFTTIAEAVRRLRSPGGDFDVFFPTIDSLPRLAAEGLLLPLTHELLPHVGNLWPFFVAPDGPFYDVGQRFSVPYTVYSTGIGWRRDLVRAADAPERLDNAYDAYWNERYRGEVGIYDDYREAIAMALLRRGEDPNAGDAARIDSAVDDLVALAEGVDVEVSAEGAYRELQTGEYAFQQSWSGDLLSAKRFGAVAADDADRVAFTWPRGGIVGCDLTAICARGRNPVLAHAFVDHLLDVGVAMENFRWNGYQPPVGDEPPHVDPWLRAAILHPDDLHEGRFLRPLDASADARWRTGWQRFLASVTA